MMTHANEFHKAEKLFDQMRLFLDRASEEDMRMDRVERRLFALLLRLGLELLRIFIARCGDGDRGRVITRNGRKLRRLKDKRKRRYVSIFGELNFKQYVYAPREGQKIEYRAVDEQLGLPPGEHSYVLQDWQQRMSIKESFEEAGVSLEAMLGLRVPVGTAERMNQHLAEQTEAFRLSQPPPDPTEEAELLVYANDCKGVPMRRSVEERASGHRRTKGQKANKKKMACAGSAYSVAPFVRTPDDILDEVVRKERAHERPKPRNKRLWAEMTRAAEGEPLNGKTQVFIQQAIDLQQRDPEKQKTVVCLMDGEKALREQQHEWLPRAIGVLDIWHVTEYLWSAAYCFHAEGSDAAKQFVEHRLRTLLEGKVGYVIGHFRRLLTQHKLSAARRKTLQTAITYFDNNRQYMKYDEYLAAGFPIGSGVAEGACRHVVKDRMEQTGMRWTEPGAQAMLHLRAVYINGDWDEYLEYHIENEQAALYGKTAA